jgi:hypothetical protein
MNITLPKWLPLVGNRTSGTVVPSVVVFWIATEGGIMENVIDVDSDIGAVLRPAPSGGGTGGINGVGQEVGQQLRNCAEMGEERLLNSPTEAAYDENKVTSKTVYSTTPFREVGTRSKGS